CSSVYRKKEQQSGYCLKIIDEAVFGLPRFFIIAPKSRDSKGRRASAPMTADEINACAYDFFIQL
ncbi:MAG: hypothetical protein IJO96_04440, partial [Oscillospiraceae bacterium]|nr:hypothetical protein [Oscillospiraceae bacterium]